MCEARVRAEDADKERSEIKEFQICQDQKNLTKSTIHLLPSERCSLEDILHSQLSYLDFNHPCTEKHTCGLTCAPTSYLFLS